MWLNIETIIYPRMHHLGLTTASAAAMIEWNRQVFGMTIVHTTPSATAGHKGLPPVWITWLSSDEANHRLALLELTELDEDPRQICSHLL